MSAAFTLTLAYLAENIGAQALSGALAAYITGNVASNLFGRLMAAALADHFGLATNFYVFAGLNLAGAILAWLTLTQMQTMPATTPQTSPLAAVSQHLKNRALQTGFVIGFLILFAFIGTFTYVNFVLADAPIRLKPMSLGLVYLVFLPSIVTTPFAGRVARRTGTRLALLTGFALALIGLPMLLARSLPGILTGLVLVAVGTFFAQAAATSFVSRAAQTDSGAASGLYLAFYFSGGLAGAALLGRLFDGFGWMACVAGIGAALTMAAGLSFTLADSRPLSKRKPDGISTFAQRA
jgi:predicted MFS family arabinose efflux permease